jgi:hypothetical protein
MVGVIFSTRAANDNHPAVIPETKLRLCDKARDHRRFEQVGVEMPRR